MTITKPVRKKFIRLFDAAAPKLGARMVRPAPDFSEKEYGAYWEVDTAAGRLEFDANASPRMFTVFCRFDDARAGEVIVGATRPSGKWNWHQTPDDDENPADFAARLVREFGERLVSPHGLAVLLPDRSNADSLADTLRFDAGFNLDSAESYLTGNRSYERSRATEEAYVAFLRLAHLQRIEEARDCRRAAA